MAVIAADDRSFRLRPDEAFAKETEDCWTLVPKRLPASRLVKSNEMEPAAPPGMDPQTLYGKPIEGVPPLLGPPSDTLVLYHGTSMEGLTGILTSGFRLPLCKQRKECSAPSSCRCHMMGRCFYFAGFEKALRHAKQSPFWEQRKQGAVLRVAVDPGRWRVQPKLPCSCPCKKPYVDHQGKWMESFDGLFLEDGSLPAVRTSEWCIKSAKQLLILDSQSYSFH